METKRTKAELMAEIAELREMVAKESNEKVRLLDEVRRLRESNESMIQECSSLKNENSYLDNEVQGLEKYARDNDHLVDNKDRIVRFLKAIVGGMDMGGSWARSASLILYAIEGKTIGDILDEAFPGPKPKQYKVVFGNCGEKKINVIKCIREHLGLGLKEAKDASEAENSILLTTEDEEKAKSFVYDLRACGAAVNIEESEKQ